MKWKLASLIAVFYSFFCMSVLADTVPHFKHIVFFGDSLSDNGNFYNHSDHLIPKYPPYYEGRFTNGFNWADLVSYNLYAKYGITAENYAVGGATAFLHNPFYGYLPVTISMEIADYKIRNLLTDKSDTLFSIWIGGNDYLPGNSNVDQATTDVVDAITSAIQSLASYQGVSFLVISMPNLQYTPQATVKNLVDNYKQLSAMHNQKLHDAIVKLRAQYPSVNIIEFDFAKNPILKEYVTSPEYRAKMNEKYHVNITDTINACWKGSFANPAVSDVESSLAHSHNMSNSKNAINLHQLAQQIVGNPSLMEAYRVGQMASQDNLECVNPNQHLFWDNVHPTAATHRVLSQILLDKILSKE